MKVTITTDSEFVEAALKDLTYTGGSEGWKISRFIDDCVDGIVDSQRAVEAQEWMDALPDTYVPIGESMGLSEALIVCPDSVSGPDGYSDGYSGGHNHD